MAQRHDEYLDAGAVVAAIVRDTPQQNAAMVEKLQLPFPILSDPDRSKAIKPYLASDDGDPRDIATPTTVVIGPDGDEVWRHQSSDFADRPPEDGALEVVRAMDLDPTTQPPPTAGDPEPGPKAFRLEDLPHYYRGAKFGSVVAERRHPEIAGELAGFRDMLDRYVERVQTLIDG